MVKSLIYMVKIYTAMERKKKNREGKRDGVEGVRAGENTVM